MGEIDQKESDDRKSSVSLSLSATALDIADRYAEEYNKKNKTGKRMSRSQAIEEMVKLFHSLKDEASAIQDIEAEFDVVEDSYLEYVHSHAERLRVREEINIAHRKQFKIEVEEIKSELIQQVREKIDRVASVHYDKTGEYGDRLKKRQKENADHVKKVKVAITRIKKKFNQFLIIKGRGR